MGLLTGLAILIMQRYMSADAVHQLLTFNPADFFTCACPSPFAIIRAYRSCACCAPHGSLQCPGCMVLYTGVLTLATAVLVGW